MNLSDVKAALDANTDKLLRFVLPDGDTIPAQFHVTEVGYVTKHFIDCGGTIRHASTIQFQIWIGNDSEHRLTAGKLARILELAKDIVPNEDLPVEVEYEGCTISQYPVKAISVTVDDLIVTLTEKHTDCLAKEACGTEPATVSDCCAGAGCGCG